nr:VIT1/CCC1 transporter family protein [Candidatus Njordarchaeum guaymaensis]
MSKLSKKEIAERARTAIEEGEKWHSRVSVREIVFGFNDGSVSTLAFLAGVVGGALGRSEVLISGISAVIAGAVSMAVGAYISSKSEIDHHKSEIEKEKEEIEKFPEIEKEELRQIYQKKAKFAEKELRDIINRVTEDKKTWVDLMMKEELGLFQERFENPVRVGLVMFAAFIIGGLAPLTPFFVTSTTQVGLVAAVSVTLVSLFIIGVWKTTFTRRHWVSSGTEMMLIGIIATVVPYILGNILVTQILSGVL